MFSGNIKQLINKHLALLTLVLFTFNFTTLKADDGHSNHTAPTVATTDSLDNGETAAQPPVVEGVKEKFNAGEMILHHIKDAPDWHLFDWHGHAVSIPLPVILYSKEKGLSIFSSSKFEHGHATHDGYALMHGKIVAVDAAGNHDHHASFYNLSISKNVLALFISLALLCFVFISIAKTYKNNPNKAPKGLQSLIEPLIIFIRDDVVKASIGKGYERFVPYMLMLFFFIFLNNLLGLIPIFPGGANLTGNIAITLTLAVFTFIITHANAKRDYWIHIFWPPGIPTGIKLILIPIEIMGVFIKPVVLTLRLFANITAGHIIGLAFISLIFIFGELSAGVGYGVAIFSVAFKIFMMVLELLVCFLQAYVFTLLSSIYIGTAMEEHHHEEAHH